MILFQDVGLGSVPSEKQNDLEKTKTSLTEPIILITYFYAEVTK